MRYILFGHASFILILNYSFSTIYNPSPSSAAPQAATQTLPQFGTPTRTRPLAMSPSPLPPTTLSPQYNSSPRTGPIQHIVVPPEPIVWVHGVGEKWACSKKKNVVSTRVQDRTEKEFNLGSRIFGSGGQKSGSVPSGRSACSG